jgi:uncharacterized protein YydD (DUF2326 family)
VAWLLLAAFSQIFNKNSKQKAQQKCLKTIQSSQKRRELKVVDNDNVIFKEISATEKNPNTSH